MIPVVFDLDGTLIDSLGGITAAANAVLAERELPMVGENLTVGFVGRGEGVFIDRLIEATDLDPNERDHLLSRFVHHYERAAETTPLMPGERPALDLLKAKGVAMGLVTNKPRAPLATTLRSAGLADDFDVVLAGDDLPTRKPDPGPLLEAIRRLDAPSCIYVGDSDIDGETALTAGQPFLLFTEGIRTLTIDQIPHLAAFSDFRDLPDLVEQFAA